jgi:DNA-binding response OmpR family regulator
VASLLLVEDDNDLRSVLAHYLTLSGFSVTSAATAREALDAFRRDRHALCILDIGLPDLDGFALARQIKELRADQPLVFLTSRALKPDRVRGLQLGADDYICKPFEADELVLRVRNILRRSAGAGDTKVRIGRCEVDFQTRMMRKGGMEKHFTRKEAELLSLLWENRGRLLTRSEILIRIWGRDDYFLGRSMDVFVTRLRRLLGDEGVSIKSVRGTGFVLTTAGM